MSNIISFKSSSSMEESFSMSNGLTDVFISVLALSGSQLAETIDEKRLIVWLSEKDQKTGDGTVGFDVCDIPWNEDKFYENKEFMLKVVRSAENRLGWEKLEYTPNEELLFPCLKLFADFISKMDLNDIRQESLNEWIDSADDNDPINCGFPRCEKHDTLLTHFGCQICNN